MSKLKITLEIGTIIEENGDYYGTSETLDRTVSLIKRDMKSWRLFLARGAGDPKPYRAAVKLVGLTILDVDDVPVAAPEPMAATPPAPPSR